MNKSHSDDETGGCCRIFRKKGNPTSARPKVTEAGLGRSADDKVIGGAKETSSAQVSLVAISSVAPETTDVPSTGVTDSPSDHTPTVQDKETLVSSDRPTNQRARAEERFQKAVEKLRAAVPTAENPILIPDALTLKNLDRVDDVEGTGKQLEASIEELMSSRKELKTNRTTRQAVGDCITDWFKASFPYIKPALKVAGVCSSFLLHLRLIIQDLVPSPYAIPISALVFLLQVIGRSKWERLNCRLLMMPVKRRKKWKER
jgi:hypothetical protein